MEYQRGDELDRRRLTPVMSSRKLLALRFIKRYFAQWGHSPTLGELAAELDVSRKRAYDLVHQLAEDRMIEVTAGKTRGIRLVDRGEELSEDDVLARLIAMGWTVAKDNRMIAPPLSLAFPQPPLTEKGLPEELDLDFNPPAEGSHESTTFAGPQDQGEGIDGESHEERRRARSAADAGRAPRGQSGGLGAPAP